MGATKMMRQSITSVLVPLTLALVLHACQGFTLENSETRCFVFSKENTECGLFSNSFYQNGRELPSSMPAEAQILDDAFSALAVLQNEYFDAWQNTWPSSIDWTGAVVGTIVLGMLTSLTKSLDAIVPTKGISGWMAKENLISSFYDAIIGYHFGQNIAAIKNEAYDDMLWVVLGWIEATNFVKVHESLHYPDLPHDLRGFPVDIETALGSLPWRGRLWSPSFENRAHVFWDLAAKGWDTKLCHGGMTWNPRLEPYKNAITNELYISSSIAMYQYVETPNLGKDPKFLQAAVEAYKWLAESNMTNSKGLFVDGFHISRRKHGNIECDTRDEMVYTYNQGVILTSQRELWDVTGSQSYLNDGHLLIQSTIRATGWDLSINSPMDDVDKSRKLPRWRGLGRGGILEDLCDASGTCSQDSQTFKGIYFHHLTAFCTPLGLNNTNRSIAADIPSFQHISRAHNTACRAYLGWIRHNALAALGTRDAEGRFGMWWGPGLFGDVFVSPERDGIDHQAVNTTDYRNHGTPDDHLWGRSARWLPGGRSEATARPITASNQQRLGWTDGVKTRHVKPHGDPNNRGRGRTVETQVGGLALLRAYWEISQSLPSFS